MRIINNDRRFESPRWIDKNRVNLFKNCSFFYPSLRQGLYQLLKQLNLKTVLLPFYCPEGIINPFIRLGYVINYYDVDVNGNINGEFDKITTDVFVYIHYFGIYHENNIEKIKRNITPNSIFIEDFAHTIFTPSLKLTGDFCTFSFTKMIGVTEGSCILCNKQFFLSTLYKRKIFTDKRLKLSLYLHLVQQSLMLNKYFSRIFNLFLYAFGLWDSYKILMSSYTVNYPSIGRASTKVLNTIDFEKINEKRIKFAKIYLENLNPKLLFSVPKQYYTRQALFAFPILTADRNEFCIKMKNKDIYPLFLTARWWFGAPLYNDLCQKHLLLPINHNLAEEDIYRVINEVNNIFLEIEKK